MAWPSVAACGCSGCSSALCGTHEWLAACTEALAHLKSCNMAAGICLSKPALWVEQCRSQEQEINILGDNLFPKMAHLQPPRTPLSEAKACRSMIAVLTSFAPLVSFAWFWTSREHEVTVWHCVLCYGDNDVFRVQFSHVVLGGSDLVSYHRGLCKRVSWYISHLLLQNFWFLSSWGSCDRSHHR